MSEAIATFQVTFTAGDLGVIVTLFVSIFVAGQRVQKIQAAIEALAGADAIHEKRLDSHAGQLKEHHGWLHRIRERLRMRANGDES